MPEKYTKWDVVDYLESAERAAGYLESCLEEAPEDIDFLRLALSDIGRAKGMGKLNLGIAESDLELLQALADGGHLSAAAAADFARKLGLQLRITA